MAMPEYQRRSQFRRDKGSVMSNVFFGCKVIMLTSVVFWAAAAGATDKPQVDIRTQQRVLSGHVADGTPVAHGRITSRYEHVGFQVWCEGVQTAGEPDRCVLNGQQQHENTLKVRIGQRDGWRKNAESGKGIIINTGNDSMDFDVVVDGDQTVKSDHYVVEIRGVSLIQ